MMFPCFLFLFVLASFTGICSLKPGSRQRAPARLFLTAVETPVAAKFEAIQQNVNDALSAQVESGEAPEKFAEIVRNFINEYAQTYQDADETPEQYQYFVTTLLKFVQESLKSPFKFEPFHEAIREPFDYYEWGSYLAA